MKNKQIVDVSIVIKNVPEASQSGVWEDWNTYLRSRGTEIRRTNTIEIDFNEIAKTDGMEMFFRLMAAAMALHTFKNETELN